MGTKKLLSVFEVKKIVSGGKTGDFNVGCPCRGTLLLRIGKSGSTSWVYRVMVDGRVLTFGLGGLDSVSLGEARAKAERCALDPEQAKADKQAGADEAAPTTCSELFAVYLDHEKRRRAWGDEGAKKYAHYASWLATYAAPVIGDKDAAEVTTADVAEVLNRVKAAGKYRTADNVKTALSKFFKWCILVRECRPEIAGNPAKGDALAYRLTQEPEGRPHHQPMARIEDLPRFVKTVVETKNHNQAAGAACLFAILTASRYSNIARQDGEAEDHFATWDQIDLERGLWIIPAHKMKRVKNGDHVVPLSRQAVALLMRLEPLGLKGECAVFQSRSGKAFSNSAIRALIKRMSEKDLAVGGNGFVDPDELDANGKPRRMTLHGTARGTFQSWGARNGKPQELLEKSLHHTAGGITEAYQRDPMADRRRELMQAWADFCFSDCPNDWDALP